MSFTGFFKSLGEKIQAALVKVFGQNALDTVESQIKQVFEDKAYTIFTDAINAAETLTTDGTGKRAAAFAQITTDLKSSGISLASNVINLGIELIVGLLKAKSPAAPVAPNQPAIPPAV